jgi:hypothetical protein
VQGLARSEHLHVWLRNLSPHALLHRLVGDEGGALAVEVAAVLLAAAVAAVVLRATRPPLAADAATTAQAWSVAIAALPLAAPLTEEHHLALLLLPLLWAVAQAPRLSPAWQGGLVAASVLLASGYSLDGFRAFDHGVLSLAHAGKAAGAALLLAVGARLAWQARGRAVAVEAPARA